MEQTIETRPEHLRLGSAASWPAIFAGAFVAASVSLVLLALGTGLGFAEISPWPGRGVSATTFAVTTAIWLIVMQWVSSGVGGYITGRLRTRWIGTHTHEVFFRDTAHGLVMWSVATVLVAAVVASSMVSAIQGGAHVIAGGAQAAAGAMSSGAASAAQGALPAASSQANAYGVDKLFRSANPSSSAPAASDPRVEVAHIMANAWVTGSMSDEDRSYLAELVAARTGVSQADARKRVDEFAAQLQEAVTKTKAEADAARKAAAEAAIYTALSMLVGAFIASISAALGGRLRDEHYM
ncbi:MAG TPA: hypothetical protein VGO37_11955 [Steroidobacteraceae bacterium]|jgi:hypothetical protein|nr:hypothetical protein [Steroidobacteraceae bacterium]